MAKFGEKIYAAEYGEIQNNLQVLRTAENNSIDISLSDYLTANKQISIDEFLEDAGIKVASDTIQNLIQMPGSDMRWIVPEIYRQALSLGLRNGPNYTNWIASEEPVKGLKVTMPAINMSDATPKKVGMAETIQIGTTSFNQKTVTIHKYGRGIQIPYEIINYVPLNMVSIFMADFGVKMGMGLDSLALHTLLNGDQNDGSDSSAAIGVQAVNTVTFKDLLKPFVRLSRLGRNIDTMVAGEDMAIELLDMMYNSKTYGTPRVNVELKTPVPTNANVYVHGKIPSNQVLIFDPRKALVKLNALPLLIEADKIISNQVNEIYASVTTGFCTLTRDSRILMDKSIAFSGNGFPTWMDPTSQEIVTFD